MNKSNRLMALDAFRGFTIASMIQVNTPGSWSYVYAPLRHAKWHGCTPTDLVFPFFLFIAGVAMRFSFAKFDHHASSLAIKKVIRRVALIFMIGLLLNAFPFNKPLAHLRIMGVLQRIALAYGLAALICLYFDLKKIAILSTLILLGYWLILWSLGGSQPYALETNLVRSIDLKVFGESHVWKGTGIPFDPEGILSTFPAVITVIFGYLTGKLIQSETTLDSAVVRILIIGIIAIISGKIWGLFFPINKSLWTSSYVLYTAGIAQLFLAVFLWIVDVKGFKKWAHSLLVYGMNPLFAFILSIIWVKIIIYLIKIPLSDGSTISGYGWLYLNIFVPLAGNMNGSLLFAMTHIGLFWLFNLILYRKKILIKI